MNVKMLLDDVEEMVAPHVVHGFAARDGHDFALDLEDGLSVLHLDVKGVAGERHDFLPEDQRLGLAGEELVPDAQRLLKRSKLNGHIDGVLLKLRMEKQLNGIGASMIEE